MRHRKGLFILLISTALIVSAAGTVTAVKSPETSKIGNWTDLQNINKDVKNNVDNRVYVLQNDLDSNTEGYQEVVDTDKGFEPIGNSSAHFKGTFDGNGYTIKDLTIDRPDTDYVGLFGNLKGTVANVSLKNVNITGNTTVGGLAGLHIGGYVTVMNSSVSGEVTGNKTVGGLIGKNRDTVKNSYSTANVNGEGNNVGGLIGENTCWGNVNNTYATGSVTGNNTVGGLIGNNTGTVNNTYAVGEVSGVGSNVGGLVGINHSADTVDDSYWNIETTNQEKGIGKDEVTNSDIQSLKTLEMKGTNAKNNMDKFDFSNSWGVVSGDKISYPYLQNNHQKPEPGLTTTEENIIGGKTLTTNPLEIWLPYIGLITLISLIGGIAIYSGKEWIKNN